MTTVSQKARLFSTEVMKTFKMVKLFRTGIYKKMRKGAKNLYQIIKVVTSLEIVQLFRTFKHKMLLGN